MERMQSTWENVVEMDLSESGVRPVTLRELAAMGLDVDALLNTPLGYSQSNGTIRLREELSGDVPGRYAGPYRSHQRNLGGQLSCSHSRCCGRATKWRSRCPNYMQYAGIPKSLGAKIHTFPLRAGQNWEPDWDEFERAVTPRTRLVYLSNPNNPTGSVLSAEAMRRIVARCDSTGAYLLADEVYHGAEIHCRAYA